MRESKLRASVVLILILAGNAGGAAAQGPAAPASRAGFHLLETTIEDIRAAFQSKRITCRELVNLYLKRIDAYDKGSPRLNAVQTVNSRARTGAERLYVGYPSSGLVV